MLFFRKKLDVETARGWADFVIAGLGNPGARYEWTRHNLGFLAVDAILVILRDIPKKRRLLWNAEVYFVEVPFDVAGKILGNKFALESQVLQDAKQKRNIALMKPQTFMNLSGRAVARAVLAYPEAQVLVICDDVNLPWGEIRLRARGSSGGHKGLESVISELGTEDFPRIRIGVGGGELADVTEFVLQPMNESERKQAMEFARLAGQKALEIAFLGFEKASSYAV